ncbi:hypothetical protein ESCO_006573 [Escovopsis weberi]|uniref:Uncharacterized protein n=1 Tax=Escovopsis weberi TaxID=150374 RepID=A0A0M9VXM1_ESCWE|nr:hypothetical protein ESCO_006573 [Escovopsis weberi]
MAAAFRPVNTSLAKDAPAEDAMTSNPPSSSSSSHRPSTAPHPQYPQPAEESSTPTRATFAGTVAGQRPLPTSPFPQVPESAEDGLRRDGSQRSAKSPARTSMDVDMDESDGETGTVEENPGSDDESITSGNTPRPST